MSEKMKHLMKNQPVDKKKHSKKEKKKSKKESKHVKKTKHSKKEASTKAKKTPTLNTEYGYRLLRKQPQKQGTPYYVSLVTRDSPYEIDSSELATAAYTFDQTCDVVLKHKDTGDTHMAVVVKLKDKEDTFCCLNAKQDTARLRGLRFANKNTVLKGKSKIIDWDKIMKYKNRMPTSDGKPIPFISDRRIFIDRPDGEKYIGKLKANKELLYNEKGYYEVVQKSSDDSNENDSDSDDFEIEEAVVKPTSKPTKSDKKPKKKAPSKDVPEKKKKNKAMNESLKKNLDQIETKAGGSALKDTYDTMENLDAGKISPNDEDLLAFLQDEDEESEGEDLEKSSRGDDSEDDGDFDSEDSIIAKEDDEDILKSMEEESEGSESDDDAGVEMSGEESSADKAFEPEPEPEPKPEPKQKKNLKRKPEPKTSSPAKKQKQVNKDPKIRHLHAEFAKNAFEKITNFKNSNPELYSEYINKSTCKSLLEEKYSALDINSPKLAEHFTAFPLLAELCCPDVASIFTDKNSLRLEQLSSPATALKDLPGLMEQSLSVISEAQTSFPKLSNKSYNIFELIELWSPFFATQLGYGQFLAAFLSASALKDVETRIIWGMTESELTKYENKVIKKVEVNKQLVNYYNAYKTYLKNKETPKKQPKKAKQPAVTNIFDLL